MICAACRRPSQTDPCCCCGEPVLLDGRIRLDEVLGRGAMGVVYRATHDGRAVAVKDMPLVHPDGKTVELARREAAVLSQLDHAQVVRAIESFALGGRLYLVQEFVEGPTLAQELAETRFEVDEVLAIVEELLGVLAYLHGRSPPVIHRDLKPSNVIRSDRGLVLVDFGSVRDALRDPELGGSTVAGTFGYMAPEQLRGDASPATDIYGLGALAVALLSRKDPARLMDWSGAMRWGPELDVHHAVEALLERMLEPDPGMRPRDADGLAKEVAGLRQALKTGVGLPAPRSRGRSVAIALGVAGLLMALGVTYALLDASAPPPAAGPAGTPATPIVPEVPEVPEVSEVTAEPVRLLGSRSKTNPTGIVTAPDGSLLPLLDEAGVLGAVSGGLYGMRTACLAYDSAFDGWPSSLEEGGWEPEAPASLWVAYVIDHEDPYPLQALVTRGEHRGRRFGQQIKDHDQYELERLDEDGIAAFLEGPGVLGNRDTWMPEQAPTENTTVALEGGNLVPQLDETGVLGCVYSELRGLEKAELGYEAAFDRFSEDLDELGYSMDSKCAHYLEISATVGGDYSSDVRLLAEVTRGDAAGRSFQLIVGEDVVEVR
ncbi:MAG TPA: serine/threonine-protein kinase [Myxococcota bacterium]|nr:serine/threonine-protein kinase [Myxococcota bacterium]